MVPPLHIALRPGKTPIDTPYDPRGGSFTGPSYTPTLEGNGDFAKHDWRDRMAKIFGDYLKSLDELPHHFQLHFMHAAEIVGYKHPDETIRDWWKMVYFELARDMHLYPEPEEQLDIRLGDNETQWRASNHVATQE